jgi:hypothetical protein
VPKSSKQGAHSIEAPTAGIHADKYLVELVCDALLLLCWSDGELQRRKVVALEIVDVDATCKLRYA